MINYINQETFSDCYDYEIRFYCDCAETEMTSTTMEVETTTLTPPTTVEETCNFMDGPKPHDDCRKFYEVTNYTNKNYLKDYDKYKHLNLYKSSELLLQYFLFVVVKVQLFVLFSLQYFFLFCDLRDMSWIL